MTHLHTVNVFVYTCVCVCVCGPPWCKVGLSLQYTCHPTVAIADEAKSCGKVVQSSISLTSQGDSELAHLRNNSQS